MIGSNIYDSLGLDELIVDVVGDVVEVSVNNGAFVKIKVPFEWEVDDGLIEGDRMTDSYPVLSDVLERDAHLFENWENVTVRYKDRLYSVLSFIPTHDRNYKAYLRLKRIHN